MEITSSELAKRIPDFDDLLKLTQEIAEVLVKKLLLEKKIKDLEADAVMEVTINPAYQIGGKTPSMSFIDTTWGYTGINNSILPLREELAITIGELEKLRGKHETFSNMLEIFKAVSFSEKKSVY